MCWLYGDGTTARSALCGLYVFYALGAEPGAAGWRGTEETCARRTRPAAEEERSVQNGLHTFKYLGPTCPLNFVTHHASFSLRLTMSVITLLLKHHRNLNEKKTTFLK